MKTIIIEDEKPAARLLQRKLEKLGIKPEIMLHSVAESLQWFAENEHPDLIFLDIQLSDGLSFEIFEKVAIKSAIVFTTAYDEYALKASKLNSIDYLLKPVDEIELEAAIRKYESMAPNSAQLNLDLSQIKSIIENPSDKVYKKRFTIKVGPHLKIIPLEDVECFFSENKGTYLHTSDNRNYLMDATLEALEQDLDPKEFFRISRKFIIPMKAVREILMYSNSRLKLLLPTYKEDDVVVSREKVSDFRNWLG